MSGESYTVEESIETKEQKASLVLEQYERWDSDKAGATSKWEEIEAYKYATDTHNEKMGMNAFDHTTHIPVVAPIAQDLEAIIGQVVMPHEDWFNFKPQDRASAKKETKQKVLAFLKNRHKVSGLKSVMRNLISDYVTYGNCFAMVDFVDESTEAKNGYIGPVVKRISPYDIVFDPTATSFEKTAKIIRTVVSLGELWEWKEAGLVDEEEANRILEHRAGHSTTRMSTHEKNQQYVPAGFNTYDNYMTSGVVEVLWFYGDMYDSVNMKMMRNRKMAVVDGHYLLVDEEINTSTGKPHIFHAGWQTRPDNLWAMGPLDNIVGINFQVNHRENAKNDALDKLINPDEVHVGDVEEIYDEETGKTIYLAPEGGGVQELAVNTQFFQFDLQIQSLVQTARTAARLPLDLVGFRSAGEKTFGEVQALTDGAMRGFIHKAQDLEAFLEKILTAELELSADNVSAIIQVDGQVENGVIPFLDIAKGDLKVTGSLIPQGAQRFARKNQILSTLTQLANSNLAQIAGPHISGKAMAKVIEELAELEGFGLIEDFAAITEQAEAEQAVQQAQQVLASQASQPTIQEELINQELGE